MGHIQASHAFNGAVPAALGVPMGGSVDDYFWADELFVSSADLPTARGELTGCHHLAFQARDRMMVDAFHAAALAHGGRDGGALGERDYHPGYCAASVLDPDGNNIEAVQHGRSARSAPAVVVIY